jgi:hypothetical protein
LGFGESWLVGGHGGRYFTGSVTTLRRCSG